MRRSDFQTLVNLGRRAGLHTDAIYRALAGRRPTANDLLTGRGDGNGYHWTCDASGRFAYSAETGRRR